MDKATGNDNSCCLPLADGVIYVRVGPDRHPVGMMNLELVFRQLVLLEHTPEAVCNDELVAMARRYNYIPRRAQVEADYGDALRQAYAQYWERQKAAHAGAGADRL